MKSTTQSRIHRPRASESALLSQTKSKIFGPAVMVTAAFIGPGSVLVASRAGAAYGFSLLWAVVFAVVTAIILQEMAARLGIVTGDGLAQAIRKSFANRGLRVGVLGLILIGILAGNAAFQTGNLLGAATGAVAVVEASMQTSANANGPSVSLAGWTLFIGIIAWVLILVGRFELLQYVLTVLVVAMSGLFLLSTCLCRPQLPSIAAGLIPNIPPGSEWLIVALIGTTVVPYNLFLHASAAALRWPADSIRKTIDKEQAVRDSRRDTIVAVSIGGLVTAAILITAAMAFHVDREGVGPGSIDSVSDIATQLEPALGSWAKRLFGAGLFAAGLTSAITAPVAAAYAAAGCFGWPSRLSDWRLKSVASMVVFAGIGFALKFGSSPQEAILLAQAANGLLLPIIALFLIVMMNRVQLMFRFRNTIGQNVLAGLVILIVTGIAATQLWKVYEKIKFQFAKPAVVAISIDGRPCQLRNQEIWTTKTNEDMMGLSNRPRNKCPE